MRCSNFTSRSARAPRGTATLLSLGVWLGIGPAALAAVLPPLSGKHGAVATDHPLASQAGLSVLKQGGNAVDAACAAAFALGVVQPAGSGLGGGGFMLIKPAGTAAPVALDFRETAPEAARREMFFGKSRQAATRSGLAVGTPAELLGCALAVKRYGKLPLRRVLAPAIRLALHGFEMGRYLAGVTAARKEWILSTPPYARLFARTKDALLVAGQRARRPRLAATLQAIARHGTDVFYHGRIAKEIVETVRQSGGVLSMADLATAKTKWRTPLHLRYAGYDLFMMPPPSSAGVALTEVVNILRRYDLARLGHNSSRYLHRLVEALKHAFADRARFLGDPDFAHPPLDRLLSQAYANDLAKRIGARVHQSAGYGSPQPPRAQTLDGGTSHISTVDATGTAVAMTTSINTTFGSHLVTNEGGIVLNNTMDDFSTIPGKANAFGLLQSEANAIAPKKRPLSSMSPTIVCKNGSFVLAAGGSGGPTIITATLQALLNVLVFGMDVAQAVSRSRIHHQWLPDVLWVEDDLPRDVVDNLAQRGHTIKRVTRPPMPHTAVQLVHAGDVITAASDPRKYGSAAVY